MPVLYLTKKERPGYWARLCSDYLYIIEHYDWVQSRYLLEVLLRADNTLTGSDCHVPRIYGGRDLFIPQPLSKVAE